MRTTITAQIQVEGENLRAVDGLIFKMGTEEKFLGEVKKAALLCGVKVVSFKVSAPPPKELLDVD